MKTLTPDEQFFYDQAGYSYDPKTETQEQGRIKCAKRLAQVESFAKSKGIRYYWRRDQEIDSRDFSDEKPFYPLYECSAELNGESIGGLCGIDFGRGNKPTGQPYKRVVEAEIVWDAFHEWEESQAMACRDIETLPA